MSAPLSPQEFESYTALLRSLLRLSRSQAQDVASELADHMELRYAELVDRGVERSDAIEQALAEFGDAAGLAAKYVLLRNESRRRWMMKAGIGSISVCLAALVLTTLFWPDGGGEIAPAPAIAQTDSGKTEAAKPTSKTISPEHSRNEATEKKLEKAIAIEFQETPLSDAIAFISDFTGTQFYIDEKALDEVGLDKTVPINLNLKDIPTSFAIEIALRPLELGYHLREGVVIVTTPEEMENHQEVRVYNVRDLVDESKVGAKPPRAVALGGGFGGGGLGGGASGGLGTAPKAEGAPGATPVAPGFGGGFPGGAFVMDDNDRLVELITSTVTPAAWDEVGGPASIMIFRGAAVISHTSDGHRRVSKMLEDLREALK